VNCLFTRLQAQADLERLDALARDLSAIGSTATMVSAISHLYHKLQRAESGDVEELGPTAATAADHLSTQGEQVQRCELQCQLF
jgi:hypothetical protein